MNREFVPRNLSTSFLTNLDVVRHLEGVEGELNRGKLRLPGRSETMATCVLRMRRVAASVSPLWGHSHMTFASVLKGRGVRLYHKFSEGGLVDSVLKGGDQNFAIASPHQAQEAIEAKVTFQNFGVGGYF